MLNTFRSMSGGLTAKILLALLVLSFAIWGIGDMIRNPGRNFTVATVGDSTITSTEFARALHRESESLRAMLGDKYSPELVAKLHLPEQVLQKLLNHALLREESKALGLVPSDAEVVRRIRKNPAFGDSKGQFDRRVFDTMLKNTNQSEKMYIDQLREDMAANMLMDTLLAATPISDLAVRTLLAANEEQRAITLYTLSPSLIADVPSPNADQVKAYYDSHARDFTTPEYRSLNYVTISAANVHDNGDASEEELKTAYKERIDEFKRPERRAVEQLMYDSEEKANKASAMLKSGKSFAEVKKSTDIMNKDAQSLGKVEQKTLPEGAGDAVFSLNAGESTAPIKTPFGWHIFHVTAIDAPATATFEEVRPQLEKEMKRDSAENISKIANRLEDALAGGNTLAEAAHDMGLKVVSVGPLDRQGQSPQGGKAANLPDLDKFLDTAFKTDEKTESPVVTAKGGIYYIVRVEKITPERLRPLEEVKAGAVEGWKKEERSQRLEKLAQDIAAKFADSGRDAAVAQYHLSASGTANIKHDSKTANGTALPPALVADVFARKPGQGTAAYPIADGNFVIAAVNNIIPAQMTEKDTPKLAETRQNLKTDVDSEILYQYTKYLERKYKVHINEAALESLVK